MSSSTGPLPTQAAQTSKYDLTTVQNVKDWVGLETTSADGLIQACITAFGIAFLKMTGFEWNGGGLPASGSPFNNPQSYNENYDGSGSDRMFLRVWPILAVAQLTINGVIIPESTGYGSAGFQIDQSQKSLSIANSSGGSGGPFSFSGWPPGVGGRFFAKGRQNINVQYQAGYQNTPWDVELCAKLVVSLNYKRRGWIGLKSAAMANGQGTVSYTDFVIPPEAMWTINQYRRQVPA